MKKFLILSGALIILYACSNSGSEAKSGNESSANTPATSADNNNATSDSKNEKGIGKFQDVKLDPKLDPVMAAKGQTIFDVKCGACHKLTDEKLVGPGWKGVTSRHKPEWIMNFATNVDEMLSKDPKAQAMLEICLVRMPNQNLTDEDARSILEFMRKNDGVQ
jgi:cytochrome c551/c552